MNPIVKNHNTPGCCLAVLSICLAFIVLSAQAHIVGSVSNCSRESFITFPAADNDNRITGFAWLSNGFELEDATTSCTFDAVYPISGTVNLHGGTLYLSEDLVLTNPMDLQGLGTIIGNHHKLMLCSSIQALPNDVKLFKDVQLYTSADIDFLSTVSFQGDCMVTTQGNVIDLSQGQMIVDSASQLELRGVRLEGVGNNNVQCVDDTSHLVLDNVLWCQVGDISFSHGDLLIQNLVTFIGSATFTYESAMTSTIDDESTWRFDGGIIFRVGRKNPDIEPMYFVDKESVVVLGECSMITTAGGLTLTRGRLEFEKNVIIETPQTGPQYGTVIGDGVNPENDFTIYCGAGCDVIFQGGWLSYNNVASDLFYSASPTVRFTRMGPSYFYIRRDCVFPECMLNFAITTQFPPTIVEVGTKLFYDHTKIMIANSSGIINGYRTSDTAVILGGNDSLNIEYGQFVPPVVVTGINNSLVGSGSVNAPIIFTDPSAQLAIALGGGVYSNINLGGGLLTLMSNLFFGNGYQFGQSGTINLMQYCLSFGPQEMMHTTTLNWQAVNGDISIEANMLLSSPWSFSGRIMLHGNGNTLTIAPGGSITVKPNSHLSIKNITIKGINNSNVQCIDDTGVLTLDDVSWIQDGDFTFSSGSLEIDSQVSIDGKDTIFVFRSAQNCTIDSDATLALGNNLTFSYDPVTETAISIILNGAGSTISLAKATLYVPETGLELTSGRLVVKQNSNIYCNTITDIDNNVINDNGITFGDDVGHDSALMLQNGAKLTVLNGSFNYRNTMNTSLQFSQGSDITFNTGSTLNLYEDMNLNGASVTFETASALMQMPGKQINGSVHAHGTFTIADITI